MTSFLRIVRRRRPLAPIAPPEILRRHRPESDAFQLMARMGSVPHPRLTARPRPAAEEAAE